MPNAQHDYIISSINCNNILLNYLYIKDNTQHQHADANLCYNTRYLIINTAVCGKLL